MLTRVLGSALALSLPNWALSTEHWTHYWLWLRGSTADELFILNSWTLHALVSYSSLSPSHSHTPRDQTRDKCRFAMNLASIHESISPSPASTHWVFDREVPQEWRCLLLVLYWDVDEIVVRDVVIDVDLVAVIDRYNTVESRVTESSWSKCLLYSVLCTLLLAKWIRSG